MRIREGETVKIELTANYPEELPYNKLKYTTSTNDSVVSVDSAGNVTRLKKGTTKVMVSHFTKGNADSISKLLYVDVTVAE